MVGQKIREVREIANISQSELARMIHVSKQTLYKYENGIVTNIPSDKIESIATICNVTPAYLMGWEDEDRSTLELSSDPGEEKLVSIYRTLNSKGKDKLIDRAEELVELGYAKETSLDSKIG